MAKLTRTGSCRQLGQWAWAPLPRIPPAQRPQRAQGVPAAGAARFQIEKRLARIPALCWPAAVGPLPLLDQFESVGEARIRRRTGIAKIIQPAQRVVVPAR